MYLLFYVMIRWHIVCTNKVCSDHLVFDVYMLSFCMSCRFSKQDSSSNSFFQAVIYPLPHSFTALDSVIKQIKVRNAVSKNQRICFPFSLAKQWNLFVIHWVFCGIPINDSNEVISLKCHFVFFVCLKNNIHSWRLH